MKNAQTALWRKTTDLILTRSTTLCQDFATEIRDRINSKKYLVMRPAFINQEYILFEFALSNNHYSKEINWRIYNGYNGNDQLIFNIDCFILNSATKGKSFSLKQYCRFRNIPYPDNFNSIPENREHFLSQLSSFMDFSLRILEIEELKRMLFSTEWMEVPLDMSEYK